MSTATAKRAPKNGPQSRYTNIKTARDPATGRATPPEKSRLNAVTRICAIEIENPSDPGSVERITATVNTSVDTLEAERSRRGISEAAYRTGRVLQAVFERSRGHRRASGNWLNEASRSDPAMAQTAAMIYAIEDARRCLELKQNMVDAVGQIDARLVEHVLADGWTYEECAVARGRDGERGRWYMGTRFRDALEALAESAPWAAVGKVGRQVG